VLVGLIIIIIICIIIILKIGFKLFSPVIMAIYRKKKFTSPKKVGRPEIAAAHESQKVGGPRLARPNRLRRQW